MSRNAIEELLIDIVVGILCFGIGLFVGVGTARDDCSRVSRVQSLIQAEDGHWVGLCSDPLTGKTWHARITGDGQRISCLMEDEPR